MINKLAKPILYITLITIDILAFSPSGVDHISTGWDKANHFVAFFTLYILLHLAYTHLSMTIKILLLLAFAVHIEVVQYFIPNREFSFLDVLADMIGVMIGIGVGYVVRERIKI
jgi:VanZ family protein